MNAYEIRLECLKMASKELEVKQSKELSDTEQKATMDMVIDRASTFYDFVEGNFNKVKKLSEPKKTKEQEEVEKSLQNLKFQAGIIKPTPTKEYKNPYTSGRNPTVAIHEAVLVDPSDAVLVNQAVIGETYVLQEQSNGNFHTEKDNKINEDINK